VIAPTTSSLCAVPDAIPAGASIYSTEEPRKNFEYRAGRVGTAHHDLPIGTTSIRSLRSRRATRTAHLSHPMKGTLMKVIRPLSLVFMTVALAAAGTAGAQEGKTRAQVVAELEEAIKSGDVITGDLGLKRNEVAPASYAAKIQLPGKSREQVRAELADALRTGDIVTGEQGLKRNEVSAAFHAAEATAPGKTREQVKAELADAVRTGDIITGDLGFKRNEIAPRLYALPALTNARKAVQPEVQAPPAETIQPNLAFGE
jgi:ribosomal protein L30E